MAFSAQRGRRRGVYLEAMGIPVYRRRAVPDAGAPATEAIAPSPTPSEAQAPAAVAVEALDWAALRERVRGCELCGLSGTRTQTVFGVGAQDARVMIVGEAPGADEDRQGEPFVGRAGQLLNAMLKALGMERPEVFIANILKCRPPRNRDPSTEEAAACRPYLERQIALVAPQVIVALGRIAAQNLLQSSEPVGRLRGRAHRLGPQGIPLVVTYHPAYLLRSPQEKRRAWEDLKLINATLTSARPQS